MICHWLLYRNFSRSKRIKEKRSALFLSSFVSDIVHSSVIGDPLYTLSGCLMVQDRDSSKNERE